MTTRTPNGDATDGTGPRPVHRSRYRTTNRDRGGGIRPPAQGKQHARPQARGHATALALTNKRLPSAASAGALSCRRPATASCALVASAPCRWRCRPHYARTMPALCPHYARTMPALCPHYARTPPRQQSSTCNTCCRAAPPSTSPAKAMPGIGVCPTQHRVVRLAHPRIGTVSCSAAGAVTQNVARLRRR